MPLQGSNTHQIPKIRAESPLGSTTTIAEQDTFHGQEAKDHKPGNPQDEDLEKLPGHTEPNVEEKGLPKGNAEQDQAGLSGIKRALIIVPVSLVYFLAMLDNSIVSTAIPQIIDDFNSLLDVGWYGSAYLLASSAFVPLAGKIYTYLPTKWSFLAFFTIFELGSTLCGAAQSSRMLIVGRAFAGLGASGLMNGLLSILPSILPPRRLPKVMGLNVLLGQVGLACGPLIGGAFTEYAPWRWCFYLNLPIGAVVGGLLITMKIPEGRTKPPVREVLGEAVSKMDLLGVILLWPAAIMFFLALQWGGNRYAWNSSTVIGLFVGAAATFVVFFIWKQRKGNDALLPFSMLRVRVIYSASAEKYY